MSLSTLQGWGYYTEAFTMRGPIWLLIFMINIQLIWWAMYNRTHAIVFYKRHISKHRLPGRYTKQASMKPLQVVLTLMLLTMTTRRMMRSAHLAPKRYIARKYMLPRIDSSRLRQDGLISALVTTSEMSPSRLPNDAVCIYPPKKLYKYILHILLLAHHNLNL